MHYKPQIPFEQIVETLFRVACRYDGDKANNDEVFSSIYDYLQGINDDGSKSVFPCSGVGIGNGTSFLEGTLFPILVEAMPEKMNALATAVDVMKTNCEKELIDHEEFMTGCYLAGFTDGDGTISGSTEYSTITQSIRFSLGIKQKNEKHPFKEFLSEAGFAMIEDRLYGCFHDKILEKRAFNEAFEECIALKREQFLSNKYFLSELGHDEEDNKECRQLKRIGTKIMGIMTSRLNDNHGIGKSTKWFYDHFTKMRTGRYPLAFLLYVAGLMGSDGCVQANNQKMCAFIQSNQAFCEGLALAIQDAFNLEETPTVREQTGDSREHLLNGRGVYLIAFKVHELERMLFLVAPFDYNRRSQWLIVLIYRVVRRQHDFEYKNRFLNFLEDLLSFSKWLDES